jgi:hypothetical protein
MPDILDKLAGGDRRSVGRVNEVVDEVLVEPALFDHLFAGVLSENPLIRMRAADAIKKITARRPEYLQPYKQSLLERVARIEQQEVRWHVAQMLPRLALDQAERQEAVRTLRGYLEDRSRIVQTFALQALADLAEMDSTLRGQVTSLIKQMVQTGSPAVKSRSRKLLAGLRKYTL